MRNLREYVCVACGRLFLSTNKDALYCTRMCYIDHRFNKPNRQLKTDAHVDRTCPYNLYVVCQKQQCDRCGWNPKVAKARMARYQRVRGNSEVAEHG